MQVNDLLSRRSQAAMMLELDEPDPFQVVAHLCDSLTTLRNLLFERVHHDVEEVFGQDSMLMPLSEDKCEQRVKGEIEVYQIAVSAEEMADRGYVGRDIVWLADWLANLRLGENYAATRYGEQLTRYLPMERKHRRHVFTGVLERTLRESAKAPLVLYRLYPLAVRIATAVAFADPLAASEWRNQQTAWLPAIADCHDCHGQTLETNETCVRCGNPVWKYEWLTMD